MCLLSSLAHIFSTFYAQRATDYTKKPLEKNIGRYTKITTKYTADTQYALYVNYYCKSDRWYGVNIRV